MQCTVILGPFQNVPFIQLPSLETNPASRKNGTWLTVYRRAQARRQLRFQTLTDAIVLSLDCLRCSAGTVTVARQHGISEARHVNSEFASLVL